MNFTNDMLRRYLSELTIPQKEEVEAIYKNLTNLDRAYYDSLEDALNNKLELQKVLEAIDIFEFENRYKYSAIFEITNDEVTIEELMNKLPIENKKIEVYNLDSQNLKFRRSNNEFKLNYLISFKHIDERGKFVTIERANNVLIAFHKINEQIFLEVSVSDIRLFYRQNDPDYFKNMIYLIKNKLSFILGEALNPVNFCETVLALSNKTDLPSVKCTGKSMNTKKRAQATLNSGNSTDLVLPILGDLEVFIEEKSNLFTKNADTLEIKKSLLEFIEEIKINSDYPWINLTWGDTKGPKVRTLEVKYLFYYQKVTILSYYSHSLGREGMRDATKKLLKEFVSSQSQGRVEEVGQAV